MPVCTLLTDFGTADYYVGALKGVLTSRAPEARLIDLGHEIAAGDVEGGAWLLAAAAPTFPAATVHLAVVDPGVGSTRRILAAAAGDQRFVGPDNGLLLPAIEAAQLRGGTAARVHTVERPDLWLAGPGATFHGRDRFAPTAAALLSGEPLEALGPPLENPVRLDLQAPRRLPHPGPDGGLLYGRVAHVDRYGNLVTDLPAEWLEQLEEAPAPVVEVAGHRVTRRVTHYAEIPPGEPAWLVGSLGTVEVSLRGVSVAKQWAVRRGDGVVVRSLAGRELQ